MATSEGVDNDTNSANDGARQDYPAIEQTSSDEETDAADDEDLANTKTTLSSASAKKHDEETGPLNKRALQLQDPLQHKKFLAHYTEEDAEKLAMATASAQEQELLEYPAQENDDNILPLPPPTSLNRGQPVLRDTPQSLPGAHRYGLHGVQLNRSQVSETGTMSRSFNTLTASATTTDLPQAQQISSSRNFGLETTPSKSNLPRAEEVRASQQNQQPKPQDLRDQCRQEWSRNWCLLGILIVVAAMVLVAVLVPSTSDGAQIEDTTMGSIGPTSSPTQPTMEDLLMLQLPEETIQALENAGSPQSRALEWLREDVLQRPQQSSARLLQRFVLATLFYSTNGHQWANNHGWLNHSLDECRWYNQPDLAAKGTIAKFYPGFLAEITPNHNPPRCHPRTGLYQHLWLDQNNLQGHLPNQLWLLTSLQSLSTSLNPQLAGTLGTQLGKMTQLEQLFVYSQALSGSVPSEIGLLRNLSGVSVFGNSLEGSIPSEFWRLTQLRTIGLGQDTWEDLTIPTSVGTFHRLRWMELTECQLSGTIPTQLGLVSTLEWATLFRNRLVGSVPSQLGSMSGLWLLSLSGNQLEGTLPTELGQLPSVFGLDLASNRFTGSLPSQLGNLAPTLILSLHVGYNRFSGTIPSQLGRLSLLQKLSLHDNTFTGAIPSQLGMGLLSVEWLELHNNSLKGVIPQQLGLPTLHTLSLGGNPMLSGTIPAPLCRLNHTCMSSSLVVACPPMDGLTFDCQPELLFCGCNCSCNTNLESSDHAEASINRTVVVEINW